MMIDPTAPSITRPSGPDGVSSELAARLLAEIAAGLPSEPARWNDAVACRLAHQFRDDEADALAPSSSASRSASLPDDGGPGDHTGSPPTQPIRRSHLLHHAVETLCEHLYNPGPQRFWDGPGGDRGGRSAAALLATVAARNRLDTLMQTADRLATLGGAAAIEIHVDPVAPAAEAAGWPRDCVELYLYGPDEFAVWTAAEDPVVPIAVCTRSGDAWSGGIQYRLWTSDEWFVLQAPEQAAGRPELIDAGENPYGTLPFSFVWYQVPVNSFWQIAPGRPLLAAGRQIDRALSRLAKAVEESLCPIGIARNVDPTFRLVREPGSFQILRPDNAALHLRGMEPSLNYLATPVDVAAAWLDIERYEESVLRHLGLPPRRSRGGGTLSDAPRSGLALLIEDLPLLNRARARRLPFAEYEQALATKILACAGSVWSRPDLLRESAEGLLSLEWRPLPDEAHQELPILKN